MKKYIPDSLWFEIESVIPKKETLVGRPEHDRRKTLNGIMFVARGGIPWNMLPDEYGPHTTVHGKFMKWTEGDVFKKIFKKAKKYYAKKKGAKNWFSFDTTSKKAPFAEFGGKNPTDRARNGIKFAVMVDRNGAPMSIDIFPANVHDSKTLDSAIKKMKKSKNIRIVSADSAFDVKKLYSTCKDKNLALVASINPRRKKGVHKYTAPCRWIIEQFFWHFIMVSRN